MGQVACSHLHHKPLLCFGIHPSIRILTPISDAFLASAFDWTRDFHWWFSFRCFPYLLSHDWLLTFNCSDLFLGPFSFLFLLSPWAPWRHSPPSAFLKVALRSVRFMSTVSIPIDSTCSPAPASMFLPAARYSA